MATMEQVRTTRFWSPLKAALINRELSYPANRVTHASAA